MYLCSVHRVPFIQDAFIHGIYALSLTVQPIHSIPSLGVCLVHRYIKAWPLVPADFVDISSGSLNPVEVKAWLFTNLPDKHRHR
jgi:hypothetical protein